MNVTTDATPPDGRLFTPAGYAALLASPRGRAFHLRWMAHAEEADEGVFDAVLARMEIPELHRLIRIHAEDEQRHAALLRQCAARAGVAPEPVPPELHYIQRIRGMLADEGASLFAGGDIMLIFAMLQVVEERGVRQFPLVAQALRVHDAESAAVLAGIIRDEQRHVGYASAVSSRFAPDRATLDHVLERCRDVEARAFAENERAYLRFASEHGILPAAGAQAGC